MERTGERIHEAALLIAKSHLLAGGGERGRSSRAAADAAEACLRRALDVARAQGARLLELRAAVALAGIVASAGAAPKRGRCSPRRTRGSRTGRRQRPKSSPRAACSPSCGRDRAARPD